MPKEYKNLNKSLSLIAKSSVIVFAFLIISKIFSYIYKIIIAKGFGPEIYGLFTIATTIIGFFTIIPELGLPDGILRYISFYRGKKEASKIQYIFSFTLKFLSILGIVFAIILFFLSEFISENIFHNPELIIFLKYFSITIPIFIISNIFLVALRAYEKVGWYSFISQGLSNISKVVFIGLFLLIGLKANSVIFSYIFSFIAVAVVSILLCKKILPEIFIKNRLPVLQKKSIYKELIKYSLPLLFFTFIYSLFYWTDSLSLGFFKSAIEVGIYNAAVPITLLLLMAPDLFIQLFFPLISKEYARKNNEMISELSKQVSKWIFIINLPVFLLIFLFPGAIINILFGSQYLEAENALRILAISSFLSSIFVVSSQLILISGRSKVIMIDIIIASILNLILNIILIPIHKIIFLDNSSGLIGASLSTMISALLANFLFIIQAKKYLSVIPIRRKMVRIALISLIPLFILIVFKSFVPINLLSIILLSALFFLIYFFLILIFGGFDKNDLMIINKFKKKFFNFGRRNH